MLLCKTTKLRCCFKFVPILCGLPPCKGGPEITKSDAVERLALVIWEKVG